MSHISSVNEVGDVLNNLVKTATEDGLSFQEFEEQESFLMEKLQKIELTTTRKAELRYYLLVSI